MAADKVDINQLIVDHLSGNISPQDEKLLMERLENDEAVRRLWKQSSDALRLYQASSYSNQVPVEQRFEALLKIIEDLDQPDRVSPALSSRSLLKTLSRPAWAAAALIPILLTLGWLFFRPATQPVVLAEAVDQDSVVLLLETGEQLVLKDDQPIHTGAMTLAASKGTAIKASAPPASANRLTIHVPKGKTYQLELPDGTRVRMNSDSRLAFFDAFVGDKRIVTLEGEAFFEVAHDDQKPFIVTTEHMSVEVLGTSFNLRSYKGTPVQTSLVSGRVRAQSRRGELQQIDLSPGMAAVEDAEGRLQQVPFDSQRILSWLHGVYFFNNERLGDIMTTVNRLSGYEVVLLDPHIADIRLSGAYERDKPLSLLLDNIASASTVRYEIKNKSIHLRE